MKKLCLNKNLSKKKAASAVIIFTIISFLALVFAAEKFLFYNGERWIQRISVIRLVIYAVIFALFFVFYREIKNYLIENDCLNSSKFKYLAIVLACAILFYIIFYSKAVYIANFSYNEKQLAATLMLFFIAGLCTVYFGKKPAVNIFILTAAVMPLFSVILVVQSIVDELPHFTECFNLSIGNFINIKANAVLPKSLQSIHDSTSFYDFINNFQIPCDYSVLNAVPQKIGLSPSGYSPLMYFPAVIGLFIGRHLNLNVMDFYYFGRFLNVIFYVLMSYAIVKILPCCKNIFFAVLVMPQLAIFSCAYSSDGVGNLMTLLYIALCLNYAYKKENMKVKDYILLALTAVFIVFYKGAAYSPILFFIFAIPMKKFFKKDVLVKIAKIAVPVLIVLLAAVFYKYLNNLPLGLGDTRGGAVDEALQFKLMKAYPGRTLYLLFNWYSTYAVHYLKALTPFYFIGSCEILFFITYIYYIFVAFTDRSGYYEIERGKKREIFICVITILGVCTAVALALYMQYTPVGSADIKGIQLRYFIPIFPVLFMFLNNFRLKSSIKDYNLKMNFFAEMVFVFSAALMVIEPWK